MGAFALGLFLAVVGAASAGEPSRELKLDLREFRVITSDSGDDNYYTVVEHSPWSYIHAAYRPPYETTVLGQPIPDRYRRSTAALRWKWRAVTLPQGGNECVSGRGDSAAVVYVTWRSGLRWYSIKYVWSSVGPKGVTCDRKRNVFRAQDTVIVESGPPLEAWQTVTISPDVEFRNHFEDGNAAADVPDLVGIGIMSDGDQTHSVSEADYADFVIVPR
jgi:hypothetical protein